MKGLLILLGLMAAVGAGLFVLTRDSDVDLERLEADARARLDAAEQALHAVTPRLDQLRVIRPDLGVHDRRLGELRERLAGARRALSTLAADRPSAAAPRGPALEQRRAFRVAAAELAAACADFEARIALIDDFARGVQPRLKVLLAGLGEVFALKNRREGEGEPLGDELRMRLERLQRDASAAQQMARQVLGDVEASLAELEVLAGTARNETERLIRQLDELHTVLTAG